jgi:Asp-tRNA(Asn)/Glu-tRNA(Gln) amidotransferase A subunit family amidase
MASSMVSPNTANLWTALNQKPGQRTEMPPGGDRRSTTNVYAHTRTVGFGDEVKRRMLLGTYALTAEYVHT